MEEGTVKVRSKVRSLCALVTIAVLSILALVCEPPSPQSGERSTNLL